ncbi:MAG TPA: hypothetical protein PLK12_10025 [Prolixibacteraceae bacterium]|nr:hypothetical protein [Prolixibacteraceae bacterium]
MDGVYIIGLRRVHFIIALVSNPLKSIYKPYFLVFNLRKRGEALHAQPYFAPADLPALLKGITLYRPQKTTFISI